jgi:hypothetical protein
LACSANDGRPYRNLLSRGPVTPNDPITIDLGPIGISALGLVTVDVPVASLTGRGSGAVGSLLCVLGQLLSGLLGGGVGSPGAEGVVNAINNRI